MSVHWTQHTLSSKEMDIRTVILLIFNVSWFIHTTLGDTCEPRVRFVSCRADTKNQMWGLPFDTGHTFSIEVDKACRRSVILITWKLYDHGTHEQIEDLKEFKNKFFVYIRPRSLPLTSYILEATVQERIIGEIAGVGKAVCWFKIEKPAYSMQAYKLRQSGNDKIKDPLCTKNCEFSQHGKACLDQEIYLHVDTSNVIVDYGKNDTPYFELTWNPGLQVVKNRTGCPLKSCNVLLFNKNIKDTIKENDFLRFHVYDRRAKILIGDINVTFYAFIPSTHTAVELGDTDDTDCSETTKIYQKHCKWKLKKFYQHAKIIRAKVRYDTETKESILITVGDIIRADEMVDYYELAFPDKLPLEFYWMFDEGHELGNWNTAKVTHSPTHWHFTPLLRGNTLISRLKFAWKIWLEGLDNETLGRKMEPLKNLCEKPRKNFNLCANYVHSTMLTLCCTEGSKLNKINRFFYFPFVEEVLTDLRVMVEIIEHSWSGDRVTDEYFRYEDLAIRISAILVRLELPIHISPTANFIEKRSLLTNRLTKLIKLTIEKAGWPLAHGSLIASSYYTLRYCIHANLGQKQRDAVANLNFTTAPPVEFHKFIPEDYPDYGGDILDFASREKYKYSTISLINSSMYFMDAVVRTMMLAEHKPQVHLPLFIDQLFAYDYPEMANDEANIEVELIKVHTTAALILRRGDFQKGVVLVLKREVFYYMGLEHEIPFDFVMFHAVVQNISKHTLNEIIEIDVFRYPITVIFTFPKNDSIKMVKHTMPLPSDWHYWTADEINKQMLVLRLEAKNESAVAITLKDIRGVPTNRNTNSATMMVILMDSHFPIYPDHFQKDVTRRIFYFTNDTPVQYYRHSTTDCFLFLAVVPVRPNEDIINTSARIQMQTEDGAEGPSFSLGVAMYQCPQLINDHLQIDRCYVPEYHDERSDAVVCKCNTTFVMVAVAENVKQKKMNATRISFALDITFSYQVFIVTIVMFAAYCALLALAGRRTRPVVSLCFLADNNKSDRYGYLLGVKTSDFPGSGTTSNVMIKLHGRKANSPPYVLNYPDPDLRLLQMGNDDYFVMATPDYLGELRYIELWADITGFYPDWRCDNVRVYDLRRNKRWYFDVQTVFALRDGMECYHKIGVLKQEEARKSFRSTLEYFGWYFGPLHTFNFIDPSQDLELAFTFRLTLMLSHILLCLALTVLIVAFPRMRLMDSLGVDVISKFSDFLKYTFIVAVCASLPNFILAVLYRNTASSALLKPKSGPIPVFFLIILWIILAIIVTASTVYLLLFGWWIAPVSVASMLIVFALAIAVDIILLENIYIALYKIYRLYTTKKIAKAFGDLNFVHIVLEVENQRRFLYRRISLWGIRPFLKHLYKPLSDALLKERRQMDQLRQNLRTVISNIVWLILIVILLSALTLMERSKYSALMSKHMEEMVVEAKFVNSKTPADRVFAIEDIYFYLADTVIPSTLAWDWYYPYSTRDPGLMIDFQTKLINLVRVRRLDVAPSPCPDKSLAKLFDVKECLPFWTPSTSLKTGEGLGVSVNNYKSEDTMYRIFPAIESSYEGGGYIAQLGRTKYNSLHILHGMNQSMWITNATRAFFIEFWAFNANTETFTDVRILIERAPTKLTVVTHRIVCTTLGVTGTHLEWLRMVLIAVILLISAKFILVVLSKLFKRGIAFFYSAWWIMDIVIIIVGLTLLATHVKLHFAQDKLLYDVIDLRRHVFIPPFHVIDLAEEARILTGVVIFLCLLRCMQIFHFSDYFRVLQTSLLKAAIPVTCCLICAMIWFFVMGIIGYIRFSSDTIHFSTLAEAFVSQWVMASILSRERTQYLVDEGSFGKVYLFVVVVMALTLKIALIVIILVIFKETRRHMSGLYWSYSIKTYYSEMFDHYYQYITRCIIPIKKKTKLKGGGGGEEWYDDPVFAKELKHRYENVYKIGIDKMNLMRCVLLAVLRNNVVRQGKRLQTKDFMLMEEIARAVYILRHPAKTEPGGIDDSNILYSFGVRLPNKRARTINDARLLEMEAISAECVTTARLEQKKAITQDRLVMVPDLLSLGRMETLHRCLILLGVVFDNITFDVSPKYSRKLDDSESSPYDDTSTPESVSEESQEEEEDKNKKP